MHRRPMSMTKAITARLVRRGTRLTRADRRLTLRGGGRVSARVQDFLDRLVKRRGSAAAIELLRKACRPRLLRSGSQIGLTIDLSLYSEEQATPVDVADGPEERLCNPSTHPS